MVKGKVVQVIGPVVDIEFPAGELPEILNAVTIKGKAGDIDIDLVVEVMQHLGGQRDPLHRYELYGWADPRYGGG